MPPPEPIKFKTAARRPPRRSRRNRTPLQTRQQGPAGRRRGRRPVGRAAVIPAVPFGVPKVDVVRHDFGAAALAALPVGPVADLQAPLHHGHAALGEVLADEFRCVPPGHHVDEIRLLLAALGLKIPVAGNGERGDSGTALGAAQLGVTGQTPHDDDFVQHPGFLLTRPCRRSGNA